MGNGFRPGEIDVYADRSGVPATATLTFTGNAVADETFDVDGTDQRYTWKVAPASAYEVDIGADAEGSIDNAVAAIMANGTAGTEYGSGTLEHQSVTAVKSGTDKLVVSAKVLGTDGNGLVTGKVMTNATWDGNLVGGAGLHFIKQAGPTIAPGKKGRLVIADVEAGAARCGLLLTRSSDGGEIFRAIGGVTSQSENKSDVLANLIDGDVAGETILISTYGAHGGYEIVARVGIVEHNA